MFPVPVFPLNHPRITCLALPVRQTFKCSLKTLHSSNRQITSLPLERYDSIVSDATSPCCIRHQALEKGRNRETTNSLTWHAYLLSQKSLRPTSFFSFNNKSVSECPKQIYIPTCWCIDMNASKRRLQAYWRRSSWSELMSTVRIAETGCLVLTCVEVVRAPSVPALPFPSD